MPFKDPEKRKAYHKRYGRKHYAKNRAYYAAKRQRTRLAFRAWFASLKASGCVTCGEEDPACLDFHHTGDKTETLANMHRKGLRKSAILAEAKKCIILCANCHRKLHSSERA